MNRPDSAASPLPAAEASLSYPGWRAVLACFLMAMFVFGFAMYGQGVYLVELQGRYGFSTVLVSGAGTLSLVLCNLLATFTPELVARFGLRLLVLLGIAALAVSMILLAFAASPPLLYVAFVVMSLSWLGMGAIVIAAIVGLWFESRRGLALSLALTGASFGGIGTVPVLVFLIQRLGFQTAMLMAAAIMTVITVPAALAFVRPRDGLAAAPHGDHPVPIATTAPPPRSRAAILRRAGFWTISVGFGLAFMAQVAFIVHQIAVLEGSIGRAGAAQAVAVMTLASIAGRLTLGLVIDRLQPRLVTAACVVSQAAGLAIILMTSSPPLMFVACAMFGFSVGNLLTLPLLIIHREFDSADFTAVGGLSNAISGTASALGPVLVGFLRTASGDYRSGLALCIVFELAAAVIVLQGGKLPGPSRKL